MIAVEREVQNIANLIMPRVEDLIDTKSKEEAEDVDNRSQTESQKLNYRREILPSGKKALDGISLRAFLLGQSVGMSSCITIWLLLRQEQIWRLPFFMTTLSIFHFLEFYITARHNTHFANISAFLFSQGKEYNLAHTGAMVETLFTSIFFPKWQLTLSQPLVISIGIFMIVLGQSIRSLAMAQAGTNFNHTVQTQKNHGHQLVSNGVYRWLRHPSYFGFFWWGLGTQLVLGNVVCFLAYTLILWSFFQKRIKSEEAYLLKFFGNEYELYRSRTSVGIPFIR